MNEYGKKVRDYRRKHGISQEEMAKLCGLSRATISAIERKPRYFAQVITESKLEKVLKEDEENA